ncbi:MAG: hypothetical protein ACJAT8_002594 [Cellvibrionaceae bacterium]|jgi:hypothetical protein
MGAVTISSQAIRVATAGFGLNDCTQAMGSCILLNTKSVLNKAL